MADPVCPTGYTCKFTAPDPPANWDQWWEGPWGIVLAGAAVIAITIIVISIAYYAKENAVDRRSAHLRERHEDAERRHELDMSEQLTMQMDMVKDMPGAAMSLLDDYRAKRGRKR